jgi:hypothetical protein
MVTVSTPCRTDRGPGRPKQRASGVHTADLERVLELAEDMADIRAAEAARADMRATSEAPIPWEQVKADLGLA